MTNFRKLQFYSNAPKSMRVVQSWYIALKGSNRKAVCLTIGGCKGKSYVVDARTFECDYPSLKKTIYDMAKQFNPKLILIEDIGVGSVLLQDLRSESQLPLSVIKLNKESKMAGYANVVYAIESGKVLLRKDSQNDLIQEILDIPYGEHDSSIYALGKYLTWLREVPVRYLPRKSH